jgi:ribosomal protein S18 acetylase RimI-like enzyme
VTGKTADRAQEVVLRAELKALDRESIDRILRATGFFSQAEMDIALELIDDRLQMGEGSDYQFVVAEAGGQVAGYSCFGAIPCTRSSWDLYWIAVSPAHQGLGIGQKLVVATEEAARALGATRMYVDTSGRAQYVPTRAFYERCGYEVAARFPDFYAPGDGKVVYVKVLAG